MRLFFLILFVSTSLFAELRLGVPKQQSALFYKYLFDELETRGYKRGENLTVHSFDLSKSTKEEIESKVDIFYSSGDRIRKVYALKPDVAILFLTMQGSYKIPKEIADNVTGVYRTAKAKKAFSNMAKVIKGSKKFVFVCKKGSGLEKNTPRYIKAAKSLGISLGVDTYKDKDDIENMFKRVKKDGYDAIFMFPPSAPIKLIPKFVKMQNKYNMPVITQVEEYVKMGLLAGYSADYERIATKMVDFIQSIDSGKKPSELPVLYFSSNNIINLHTASILGVDIDEVFVSTSRIIGTKLIDKDEYKNNKLVKGDYKIAISKESPKNTIETYKKALSSIGLVENKNLKIVYFKDNITNTNADLYFITGNLYYKYKEYLKDKKVILLNMIDQYKKDQSINMIKINKANIKTTIKYINRVIKDPKIALLHHKSDKKLVDNMYGVFNLEKENVTKYSYTNLSNALDKISKDGINIVITLPFSLPNDDMDKLVEWQISKNIPILAQNKIDLYKGALLGSILDHDSFKDVMAKTTKDILINKVNKDKISNQYIKLKNYINLNTSSKMSINIDENILKDVEVFVGQ
jgi:ABC-type uncharacterized transport system substrate-binding protein